MNINLNGLVLDGLCVIAFFHLKMTTFKHINAKLRRDTICIDCDDKNVFHFENVDTFSMFTINQATNKLHIVFENVP